MISEISALRPVDRTGSLVRDVVERFREAIARGTLVPGRRLPPEAALVSRLGVSRTVFREAAGHLQNMGLLEVRHGVGIFVGTPECVLSSARLLRSALTIAPKDFLRFHELRTAVECFAARRAAEEARPKDLRDLAAMGESIDGEGQEQLRSIRLDFEFHLKLAGLSGNPLLRGTLEVIGEFVLGGMVVTSNLCRNRRLSRAMHGDIVRALRTGDPDLAEAAVRAALDQAGRRLRRARSPRTEL